MVLHPIFVIARINDRHRCLAQVESWPDHHAVTPLDCEHLIAIFESSSNALALSSELNYAKTLPPSFWRDLESFKEANDEPVAEMEYSAHPFPYIETCVTAAITWYYMQSKCIRVNVDPLNARYDRADYEGITIIDITNLQQVRYAFLHDRELDDNQSPLRRPLTAAEYVRNYADLFQESPKSKAFYDLICNACHNHELLDVGALISAWPDPLWHLDLPKNEESEVAGGSPETQQIAASHHLATLKQISMDKLFDELLLASHKDLERYLETATLLSDFWPTVKAKLSNNPVLFDYSLGKASGAVRLLAHALELESTIDMCPYQLTEDQLDYILISGSSKFPKLKILNLSGSRHLTEGLLKKIIFNHTNLTTLYLLNTPHIPLQAKLSILSQSRITEFLDTELLRFSFTGVPEPIIEYNLEQEENIVGSIQSQIDQNEGRGQGLEEVRNSQQSSFLNHMPLPVSQIILVGLKCCDDRAADMHEAGRPSYSPNFAFPMDLNGLNRPFFQSFSSIIEYMRWLGSKDNDYCRFWSVCGFCDEIQKTLGIFLAKDVSPNGEALKIHPIPPKLYNEPRGGCIRELTLPPPKPLSPGQWTLMIGHAPPHPLCGGFHWQIGTIKHIVPPVLHYAFLSTEPKKEGRTSDEEPGPSSQNHIIVEDIDGLLRRLNVDTPLREQTIALWNERLGKLLIKDIREQLAESDKYYYDQNRYLGSYEPFEVGFRPFPAEEAKVLLEYAQKPPFLSGCSCWPSRPPHWKRRFQS